MHTKPRAATLDWKMNRAFVPPNLLSGQFVRTYAEIASSMTDCRSTVLLVLLTFLTPVVRKVDETRHEGVARRGGALDVGGLSFLTNPQVHLCHCDVRRSALSVGALGFLTNWPKCQSIVFSATLPRLKTRSYQLIVRGTDVKCGSRYSRSRPTALYLQWTLLPNQDVGHARITNSVLYDGRRRLRRWTSRRGGC